MTDDRGTPFVIAIDHVQLGMPPGGEALGRAFYSELLGLPEVAKPVELADRGGVWFAGPGVVIHLGADLDHRPAQRAHPAFVIDDLGALRSRLAAAGHPIEDDPSGLDIERCYVRDPFGNRIELVDGRDAGFSTR